MMGDEKYFDRETWPSEYLDPPKPGFLHPEGDGWMFQRDVWTVMVRVPSKSRLFNKPAISMWQSGRVMEPWTIQLRDGVRWGIPDEWALGLLKLAEAKFVTLPFREIK